MDGICRRHAMLVGIGSVRARRVVAESSTEARQDANDLTVTPQHRTAFGKTNHDSLSATMLSLWTRLGGSCKDTARPWITRGTLRCLAHRSSTALALRSSYLPHAQADVRLPIQLHSWHVACISLLVIQLHVKQLTCASSNKPGKIPRLFPQV